MTLPLETGLVPSIVLSLLLVFRTNTAYERYCEGRKLWGTLIKRRPNNSKLNKKKMSKANVKRR